MKHKNTGDDVRMKGMKDLNESTRRRGFHWIGILFVFGVICMGIGFIVAANINVIPETHAQNVPTTQLEQSQSQGLSSINILQQTQQSFRSIVNTARPAVVTIETKKEMPSMPFSIGPEDNWFFFDPFKRRDNFPEEDEQQYEITGGSGFFISDDGYILTNNHVVSDPIEITVITDDQNEYKAELVGTDPMTDVALIKIRSNKKFSYLELGDSENAQIGDWVIAIGSPIRLNQTVTVGVISGKNRDDVRIGDIDYSNFIQTDAAINFGNSGGPLLDIYGNVIGINTAIAGGANVTGIGFAIPSNLAHFAYKSLKAHGEVIRAWIGVTIQEVDNDMAKSFGLEKPRGALVNKVIDGDPADKAGLEVGDLILKLDGAEVQSNSSLSRMIAEKEVGKPIVFSIVRDGKSMDIKVTPSRRPDDVSVLVDSQSLDELEGEETRDGELSFGVEVTEITSNLRELYQVPDYINGLLITRVKRFSPAGEKMIYERDIIDEIDHKKIRSIEDAHQAIEEAGDVILIKVFRKNTRGSEWTSLFFAVPID